MDEKSGVVLQLPDDMHKICRTCFSVIIDEMQICHNILLVEENKLTEVAEMLQIVTKLNVLPEDGLPMSICEDCASKLEMSYKFNQQCKKTDDSLRNLLDLPPKQLTDENAMKEISSCYSKDDELQQSFGVVLHGNHSFSGANNDEIENINLFSLFDSNKIKNEEMDSNEVISEYDNGAAQDVLDPDDILTLIEERKLYNMLQTEQVNHIKQEFLSEDEDLDFPDQFNNVENSRDSTSENSKLSIVNNKATNDHLKEDINGKVVEYPYKCFICNKRFAMRNEYRHHLKTHKQQDTKLKDQYFVCDLCNKCFGSESKLATHFYKHAMKIEKEISGEAESEEYLNILTCYMCLEKFSSSADLNSHIKQQHKIHGTVSCQICSAEFKGEVNLINHLRKHGMHIIVCKICLKRFETQSNLRDHVKLHELERLRSVFQCPICKEEFTCLEPLRFHSVVHLNDSYECKKCKRTYNNVITYNKHMQQHLEPRFLCSLCGKQYFSSVTLNCHMRSHNNEKPFLCPFCNKGFSSRATLSVHKRIHSSFKPFICSYCGYSCRQSGDLAMHIRTHTGDKPYKCTFPNCDRKFTTSSQRKEHYRRHTNERNHKCGECGKAFLESKTLKVHMLTHTGEKPHPCEVCGKQFRRIHHLSNHMRGHQLASTKAI